MTSNGAQQYDTATIHQLLLEAFNPEELRRFCRYRPDFRPAVNLFGPGQSHDDMVELLVDYCDRHVLFDQLLAEVKQVNPGQYARFEPDLRKELKKPPAETPAKPAPEKPAVATSSVQAVAKPSKDEPVPPLKGPGTGTVGGAKKRPVMSSAAQQHDGGERPGAELKKPPGWIGTLLANLLFVALIGFILILAARSILEACLPCRSVWVKAFGLPAFTLSLLHVVWPLFRPQERVASSNVEVEILGLKVSVNLAFLVDALHLGVPPPWVTYVGVPVVIVSVALSIYLVPGTPESTPIVESYLVFYNGGETVNLGPGEATKQGIELRPGHSVLIGVNIMDNADVHCTWDATQGDKPRPEQGCASWYTAPLRENKDLISILIQSKCKTRERQVNLPVKIRYP
jgi:hypothetical protein